MLIERTFPTGPFSQVRDKGVFLKVSIVRQISSLCHLDSLFCGVRIKLGHIPPVVVLPLTKSGRISLWIREFVCGWFVKKVDPP